MRIKPFLKSFGPFFPPENKRYHFDLITSSFIDFIDCSADRWQLFEKSLISGQISFSSGDSVTMATMSDLFSYFLLRTEAGW